MNILEIIASHNITAEVIAELNNIPVWEAMRWLEAPEYSVFFRQLEDTVQVLFGEEGWRELREV